MNDAPLGPRGSPLAVTAVIPAFRAADRVGVAIRSFLDQPGIEPWVVVVVDDQCERTIEVARSYGSRVTAIMNSRNVGASASRNVGLAACVTRYVYFLDSDDWIEGPLISSLLSDMERNDGDLSFGPFVVQVEDSGQRHTRPAVARSRDKLFSDWMIGKAYVPPVSVMWKTAFLRDIGGWYDAVSRNDDAELVLRALLAGGRYGFALDGLGVYLWHTSPYRVSKQSSNIADMLAIVRRLSDMPGSAISRQTVVCAAGEASYEIARTAFEEGEYITGREALAFARSLGFKGHKGGAVARTVGTLLGLENRMRIKSLMSRARLDIHLSAWERSIVLGQD